MGLNYDEVKTSSLKKVAKTLKLRGRTSMTRDQLLTVLLDNNQGYCFDISCRDLCAMLDQWAIKKSSICEEIKSLSLNLVKDELYKNR